MQFKIAYQYFLFGNPAKTEKILEVLYKYNISKSTIENCLSVVAVRKCKENGKSIAIVI